MFRLIRFALLRIEFEVHEDVRNGLTTWKRLFVLSSEILPLVDVRTVATNNDSGRP
jgi:hypothetical protein